MTEAASTALQRRDEPAGGQLTAAEQKKFLEFATSTNLDKLPEPQQHAILVAFGRHTGLRPELGDVMIYQGRFYVTIGGMRRNAHRHGLFVGRKPRPATQLERKNAGYEPDDIVWLCEIYRKGCPQPFVGWGKVTRREIEIAKATAAARGNRRATPVAEHPVEMARKRAEYDGVRAAFPLDEELSMATAGFIADAERALLEGRTVVKAIPDVTYAAEDPPDASDEIGDEALAGLTDDEIERRVREEDAGMADD